MLLGARKLTKSRAIWHSCRSGTPKSKNFHKLVSPPPMTRLQNNLAAEKEAQLQLAIAAVLNNEHTCHSAAIAFGVPRRTLYNRVNGNMKARNQAHERDQNLTHAEEKELTQIKF